MSFYDDPLVDDNAKRSEESVNAVKSLFTRKNGFISREEQPDYGVDLDVELMTAETGASKKKFTIQIKSTGEVSRTTYGEIIYLKLTSKLHAWTALPVFILKHKTLNIASKPSSNIELLLNEFSTIINN